MTPPRTVRDIITPRAISQSLGILEIKRRLGGEKRNPTPKVGWVERSETQHKSVTS